MILHILEGKKKRFFQQKRPNKLEKPESLKAKLLSRLSVFLKRMQGRNWPRCRDSLFSKRKRKQTNVKPKSVCLSVNEHRYGLGSSSLTLGLRILDPPINRIHFYLGLRFLNQKLLWWSVRHSFKTNPVIFF